MENEKISNTDIWVFKHEPQKFGDMILNDVIRPRLQKAIIEIPNIMLVGPPGVGKGTFTNIFLRETNLDHIKLNCSDETSIDSIRTKVKSFATALGRTKLKIVVMNESDYLSPSAQAMLRDLIEQVSEITRFIFQCNYGHKMIKEIQSRCQVIELTNPPAKEIYKHCMNILKKEKVKVIDNKQIISIIKQLYPDIRKIIHTLQLNTIDGKIDNIKADEVSEVHAQIFKAACEKNVDEIRKLLRAHSINYPDLYLYFYEKAGTMKSPGDVILAVGEYLYRDSLVANKEINFMTMVVSLIKRGIL
ncbi:MAG TPA: AAA family ATPase [Bacteroidales bacterium]|nr:AAA family ATPase [Bacteroidales bacterium]